jgi:ATP-dependent DNA ligase
MAAKIDGGHVTALLQTGKPVRIFSYRPAKNETGLIEHTHRVSKALKTIVPKGLGETILRGELYARDRAGARPLPSQTIGGMMNANVWLSRERQKEHGALRFVPFDVVKWRGRSFEDATYAKKLEVLQEVKRQIPWMELPDMARTPLEKARMLKAIKTKQHPQTQEGVILWELDSEKPPVKAKITSDHDVIIKGFDPGKGALLGKGIGAIQYGDPKHPQDVKGRVGTGMSLAIRKDMMEKPELYNGKIMKLKAQGVFPSGALRAPRFLSLHLDSLTGSEKVAFSSMSAELRKIVGRQP